MYKITLTLENPLTGGRKALVFQFDPPTLDQAKWNSAFPTVRTELDTLILAETPKEPATW